MSDGSPSFSNRGKSAVHLAAPGVDILQQRAPVVSVFSDDLETELQQLDGRRRYRRLAADERALRLGLVQHDRLAGRALPEQRRHHDPQHGGAESLRPVGCAVAFDVELLIRDLSGSTAFDYLAVERATSSGGPWQNDGVYAGTTNGDFPGRVRRPVAPRRPGDRVTSASGRTATARSRTAERTSTTWSSSA